MTVLHADPLHSVNLLPRFRDIVPPSIENHLSQGLKFDAFSDEEAIGVMVDKLLDIAWALQTNRTFMEPALALLKKAQTQSAMDTHRFSHNGRDYIATPASSSCRSIEFVICPQDYNRETNNNFGPISVTLENGAPPTISAVSLYGGDDRKMSLELRLSHTRETSTFKPTSFEASVFRKTS